ncbi:Pre-mRNA-splicing factor syf2, partial [Intoshia linei]
MSESQLERLRELRLKMNKARKMNHEAVIAEDKQSKLPRNWNFREQKRKKKIDEINFKKQCKEKGLDVDKSKMLLISADILDYEETKKLKKMQDSGFKDFAQATERSYRRNVSNMKPDLEAYEEKKQILGEAAYPDLFTLPVASILPDSSDAVDNMVKDLNKQIDKRSTYHRRRRYNPEETVDFINEKNRLLNKKMEYFYGKYTKETKENLERGTN